MFSNMSESWVLLAIACVVGFMFGQWLKHRKDRGQTGAEGSTSVKKASALPDKRTRKNRKKFKKIGAA